MKKIAFFLLLLVAVFAAVQFKDRPTAVVRKAWVGKAVRAVPGNVTVRAEFEMNLKSEVSGRVVNSELDPGKSFAEGEFLVQIDAGDLELDIERVETRYEAAKATIAVGSAIELELESAKEDLEVSRRLMESGQMSAAEFRKQARMVTQIEQRLKREKVNNQLDIDTLENNLAQMRRDLAKMKILAPFECVVSAVFARPGDLVSNNSSIAQLISTSRTVEARVSEENFSDIKLGQKASVRLLGYGAQQYNATVTKILPSADPETQRYIVHVSVDIERDKLVPGLTGEVSIVTGDREGAIIIPRRALIGNKVLVVEDGVVALRSVETGYESLNEVEILAGIEEHEYVITDNLDLYREGDRVDIEERG